MIEINTIVRSINPAGQVQSPGRVVGLITADHFLKHMCPPGMDPRPIWGQTFPGWEERPVAIVEFLESSRTATLEEWIDQGTDKGLFLTEEEWQEDYEKNCPLSDTMVIPVDDLEVVDA
jgi:hypothetical protein